MEKLGRELVVGDVIEISWWRVKHDRITALKPYVGTLSYLWAEDGGARIASSAINPIGMTIGPLDRFETID
jgi:hypothetical protein